VRWRDGFVGAEPCRALPAPRPHRTPAVVGSWSSGIGAAVAASSSCDSRRRPWRVCSARVVRPVAAAAERPSGAIASAADPPSRPEAKRAKAPAPPRASARSPGPGARDRCACVGLRYGLRLGKSHRIHGDLTNSSDSQQQPRAPPPLVGGCTCTYHLRSVDTVLVRHFLTDGILCHLLERG
jgi:hypothetical protein